MAVTPMARSWRRHHGRVSGCPKTRLSATVSAEVPREAPHKARTPPTRATLPSVAAWASATWPRSMRSMSRGKARPIVAAASVITLDGSTSNVSDRMNSSIGNSAKMA